MKSFIFFFVSLACCFFLPGCGNDAPAPTSTSTGTSSPSDTSTPTEKLIGQPPEIPVVKAPPAPWAQTKEFEWKDGQPDVTMIHHDEGFAYLTGVQGIMPNNSEVRISLHPDGNWKLVGSDDRGFSARAVACPWFMDTESPLEIKGWKTNQPDFPKLIHQRKGFCVLVKAGGRLVGNNDEFRLHVDEDGFWRLRARAKSPTTHVRVAIIRMKQPGTFRGEAREHMWRHGDEPVRLIHSDDGIAFLSGLSGTFLGASDWARVTLHHDSYWYLEGRSANKNDIVARAMTIRLSGTQTPPRQIATDSPSSE